MLRFGTISTAEPSKGLYRVRIDEDDVTTKLIPVICNNTKSKKDESPLEVGEHVALLMDEKLENGVIVGAVYSKNTTPPGGAGKDVYRTTYPDGSYVKFDNATGDLTINAKGKVVIEAASDFELTCGKLSVTGDIEVTGKVTANGDIQSTGGDVKTALIALNTHKHVGVQPGGGTTGTPTP